MFKTFGSGIIFGIAAAVLWAIALLLSVATGGSSLPAGFVGVTLLGGVAGYSAAGSTRRFHRGGLGRGIVAGILGGAIVLIGSVLAGGLFAAQVQARIDVWLTRLPRFIAVDWDWTFYVRRGGVVSGICFGMVNFLLMCMGSAIGALLHRR